MNSFEKIKQACKSCNIPAYPDFNTNGEETFCVYNFSSETPDNFGDDAPGAIIADLQVHLYMPAGENFFALRKQLRQALFEQGFTYPSVTLNTTEEDNTVRHITFEFEDDEEE